MHYSRAIEEKKYCIGAIEVHDSLTHCLSDYLHFLAWHVHLDARCLAFWEKDEQSSRKRKELKSIDSRRPRRSKEPCAFSPVFCRLLTYNQLKEHELFANHKKRYIRMLSWRCFILPPFPNISLFRDFNKALHTKQNEWIYTLKYVYIHQYVPVHLESLKRLIFRN